MKIKKSWLLAVSCWLSAMQASAQDDNHNYNTQNNMQNTFTAEILDENSLKAFEKRAEQKLEDFYNFLEVVSTPSYDMKLRQDAKKQALELFSGKECTVEGVKVEKLLDSCLALTQKTKSNVMGKISIRKKFPSVPDVVGYSGMLDFMLFTGSSQSVTKEASMMLIKTEKLFGSERKQVWTVYLCGIK
jgi:hypothetical protein